MFEVIPSSGIITWLFNVSYSVSVDIIHISQAAHYEFKQVVQTNCNCILGVLRMEMRSENLNLSSGPANFQINDLVQVRFYIFEE